MSKYLGVDWGEAKIGLAVGGDDTRIALPHKVVKNNDDGFDYIIKIILDEKIGVVVVGVPKTTEDGRLKIENRLKEFVGRLKQIEGVKVELTDERLTTKMAGKLNRDLGGKSLKGQDDAVAAQLILQGYLDGLNSVRD